MVYFNFICYGGLKCRPLIIIIISMLCLSCVLSIKHLFSSGISRTFQSRGPQCAIKSQEIFTLQWLSAEEEPCPVKAFWTSFLQFSSYPIPDTFWIYLCTFLPVYVNKKIKYLNVLFINNQYNRQEELEGGRNNWFKQVVKAHRGRHGVHPRLLGEVH